ncbi:hypothetical protein ACHAW5_009194 [Stephanodiscus triporus]|uniref:MI domain-containing protein n=1 Tax=Stephanodiscus triporus TaxID=2934178 RepID=A0ABD3N0U0_9STRA
MAEFSKRSEVTVETMGKVHNPGGGGIAAFASSSSSPKVVVVDAASAVQQQTQHHHHRTTVNHGTKIDKERHATTKIEEGSSRRNISRKKTTPAASGRYDNRNKRMGGTGKGSRCADDPIVHALSYANGNGGGGNRGPKNSSNVGAGDSDHGTGALGAYGPDDPLYVPEEDDDPSSYVLCSGGGVVDDDVDDAVVVVGRPSVVDEVVDVVDGRPVYGPLLTLPEFKIRVGDAIREYFDSSDPDEVVRCIDELRCRAYHVEVVKRAISLGMDEGPRERELISRLLACLHPCPLADDDMTGGFELVLDSIDDLSIDIPDAKVAKGVDRLRRTMDDVRLDVPAAPGMLDEFESMASSILLK